MRILALDLSLKNTGWATNYEAPLVDGLVGAYTPRIHTELYDVGALNTERTRKHEQKLEGMERIDWLRSRLLDVVGRGAHRAVGVHLVVMEGFAFSRGGAQHSHSREIAEYSGVVRYTLFKMGIPYVLVPPTSLKKYALGAENKKGTDKSAVVVSAVRKLGYPGNVNDEADALWLLHMAADVYGYGWVQLPKVHRDGLGKIEWPVLGGWPFPFSSRGWDR